MILIDQHLSLRGFTHYIGFLLLLVNSISNNSMIDCLQPLRVAIFDEDISLLNRLVTHLMSCVNKQLRDHCLAGAVDLLLHLVVALNSFDLRDSLLDESA